jgi:branched-chain amino acid transport system permease protein
MNHIDRLLTHRRVRPAEALPWLAALACYFYFPHYLQLGAQILGMVLFALSFDLLLGYAGIVTLGHAAYYGTGAYTAGILSAQGWHEPISGLLAAAIVAALVGLLTGVVILRTSGLALLMLGMAVTLLLGEVGNDLPALTGGADGLSDIATSPLLGLFVFDLYGRTAFLYSLSVLAVAFIFLRSLVHSPFGRALSGIRQNPARMEAIGTPVFQRRLAAFTISAGLAGLAGGLSAQTSQFVSLNVLSVELSGTVLVMLVIGGPGRLYGGIVGAVVYMIAQDALSKQQPVFWVFWLGLLLIALVLFARDGVLGLIRRPA